MSKVHATEVYFSGHVQGVGFRYTTLQVAKEFAVTGEVKNLSDGRVYLHAEGEQAEVSAFLDEVKNVLRTYIRETEEKSRACAPGYRGFTITH